MSDYLWDRSGLPDADVERLETLLGRLRTTPPLPALPVDADGPRYSSAARGRSAVWSARYLMPAFAAAAAVIVMIAVSWRTTRSMGSWEIASVEGAPHIGSTELGAARRMTVGQILVTDGASRAHMDVGTIGQVTVDPNSRVRLVAAGDVHHRLALERGTLHAAITAPPGQFIVDTPSARATDLGCAYTLHVDEEGTGMLSVTAGWVAFELDGVESFVPAGASCKTDPNRGLGTPRYDNESQAYRDAVDAFDYGDPARRGEALRVILEQGGHGDAVTLWHLIPRVDASDRAAVVDALDDQAAMPDGVTRDAVLRLDRTALDRWWDALGLGDTNWWRQWRKPVLGR